MINSDILKDLNVDVQSDVPLADYTTFRLGGPCPCVITCQKPDELISTVSRLAKDNILFVLIGGGSNLVVSDYGLDCAVIRYVSEEPLIEQDGTDLFVSGSTSLDDLARYAAEHALEGLNCTTGIPGTVGGAIVGNAGAFGKQIGDVLASVTLLSPLGVKKEAAPQTLAFRYRSSNLKESGDIVVAARISLHKGDQARLLKERQEILDVRHSKHPDLQTHPCAGSFFRNIEPTSKAGQRQAAGWFLDQAGGKDLSHGGAKIFAKHANIIVKADGCTAQDVLTLSQKMAQLAKQKFDLDLVREVKFVGRFDGVERDNQNIIW